MTEDCRPEQENVVTSEEKEHSSTDWNLKKLAVAFIGMVT
jgi:hypothetical protein